MALSLSISVAVIADCVPSKVRYGMLNALESCPAVLVPIETLIEHSVTDVYLLKHNRKLPN